MSRDSTIQAQYSSASFFLLNYSCSNSSLYQYSSSLKYHSTCQVEYTYLLQYIKVTSRRIWSQNIHQISRRVCENRLQLTSVCLKGFLSFKAQRATRAIRVISEREVRWNIRRVKKRLYWKRYEISFLTKIIISQSDLINSCENSQCISYVWFLELDIDESSLTAHFRSRTTNFLIALSSRR